MFKTLRIRGATIVLAALFAATMPQAMAQQGEPNPVISEVRVEGTQRIDPETVRSYMSLRVGDRFDPAALDRSLKSLFATGLFGDVTLLRQGPVIIARIVENPIINRIAFEGNKKLTEETLRQEVQLRPRVVYTRSRVQSDVQRIIDLYRRRAAGSRALNRFEQELADSASPGDARVLCACFKRLLPAVPEAYRELLEQIDLQGNEPGVVARELGLTRNNLTVRLHRARRHLREALLKSCQACSKHGCLDCTCGDPGAGSHGD